MTINAQVQVSGRFVMEAVAPDGSRRKLAEFDNIVTDSGLNRLGTGNAWDYCQVGTGTTAPAANDTALAAYLAGTALIQINAETSNTSVSPRYTEATKTYRFAVGTATGNLSEVGVGWAASGSLFSRALILDNFDAPTTVTVLSTEALDVSYIFRAYIPETDVTGSITISGVTYDYILRARAATNTLAWHGSRIISGLTVSNSDTTVASGNIGTIDQSPSGTGSSASSITLASYSNNSLYRDVTNNYGLNNGNVGGVRSSSFGLNTAGGGNVCVAFQCQFDPVIPKDGTKLLSLTYRISWARRP